jgi:hypothetical protein
MSHSIDNEWEDFLKQQGDLIDYFHSSFGINKPNSKTTEHHHHHHENHNQNHSSSDDEDEDDDYDDDGEQEDDNGDVNHHDHNNNNNTKFNRPNINRADTTPVHTPMITQMPSRTECEELYISTQTKIFFLNKINLDILTIFWNIKIIPYTERTNGVIKKQIRIICKDKSEFEDYLKNRNKELYYTEKIMKQIDNPNARKIKFKDVRKITVGISKKDIMNCHGKNKNAFINCFAMILRVNHNEIFHEIHVKVFNTGRMAIPGIVNDELLEKTKIILLQVLQPNFHEPLMLISEEDSPEVMRLVKGKKNKETNKKDKSYFEMVKPKSSVLINSNFNCGYYIQQEKLRTILRDKYKLHPTYDPSMYPGIKCKFYYNNELPEDITIQKGHLDQCDNNATMNELDELTLNKYTKISFMIFRTGNCLIVGNCTKHILTYVYNFVKTILMNEYEHIKAVHDIPVMKTKKNKPRKRIIQISPEYYQNLLNIEKSI